MSCLFSYDDIVRHCRLAAKGECGGDERALKLEHHPEQAPLSCLVKPSSECFISRLLHAHKGIFQTDSPEGISNARCDPKLLGFTTLSCEPRRGARAGVAVHHNGAAADDGRR